LQKNVIAQGRYRMAKRILAVSHFVAASVVESGIPADKVGVVYEGVEVPPMVASVAADQHLLGCVGYLLPEKGQETVLRAMPAVRAKFPRARLLLAGDGSCRERLEALTKQFGLQDAIVFAGFVEDVAQVYAALDIFVFPSLAEPLGTSLLAAMAWGLPVLAVASGGVPEYVDDGENGLLVAESKPDLVTDGIVRLLRNDSLREHVGQKARRKMEAQFSASCMVQNTLRAYQEILSESRVG
jgi:glycosyltransferase involved in cell wall biosynthesis